ncbi:MAG: hypothetical protein A2802_02100 [Candidatus Woykebacteria bacterium RIFCSPHIGHO2_01_FULL_43_29]|nr:MAG: hypothetical protein A2802_02100 [Candidatus Woykebacteria bacterium RIFCSPHIGHO2_01_FULL_43_29]
MANLKELQESIQLGESLKLLASANTDIAARKIKKVRTDVEQIRSFFTPLSELYHSVKSVAQDKYQVKLPKNGKTLSILITSNYRFYGSLITDLVGYFTKESQNLPGDELVIGRTGVTQLESQKYSKKFQPLIFDADIPDKSEIDTLSSYIANYETILVFYSRFETILSQRPVSKDITETVKSSSEKLHQPGILDFMFGNIKAEKTSDFIFEPEVIEILSYFDSQVLKLLLEEIFLESELARIGARLVVMDQAQYNADAFLQNQRGKYRVELRQAQNKHLLESFLANRSLIAA